MAEYCLLWSLHIAKLQVIYGMDFLHVGGFSVCHGFKTNLSHPPVVYASVAVITLSQPALAVLRRLFLQPPAPKQWKLV